MCLHRWHCCSVSTPAVKKSRVWASRVGKAQRSPRTRLMPAPRTSTALPGQYPGPGDDQRSLDVLHLAGRIAANLAHRFVDHLEPMDVRLAEVAAARVERERGVRTDEPAARDEFLDAIGLREPHLAERHQDRPGEVLVELDDLDVLRPASSVLPQVLRRPADSARSRVTRDVERAVRWPDPGRRRKDRSPDDAAGRAPARWS